LLADDGDKAWGEYLKRLSVYGSKVQIPNLLKIDCGQIRKNRKS